MEQWDSNNKNTLRKYIDTLFQVSFEGSLKGVVFDIVSMDTTQIDDYFINQDDISYYSHSFHENEIVEPYSPFLASIKSYFSKISKEKTEEIFEQLNIYYLHRSLFMNYFYDESIVREVPLLRMEVYFEEVKIMKGIIELLKYIGATTDMVFFLSELHLAKASTIRLLHYLLAEEDLNILFIGTINLDLLSDQEETMNFDKLIELIDEKEWIITLSQEFISERSYSDFQPISEQGQVNNITLCIEFLAILDAIDYGRRIYIEFSNQATISKEKLYLKVLKQLGRSYYLLKEKEAALFYDNMALSIARDEENRVEICEINIRLGYDYSIRKETQIAKKYAKSALEMAKKIGSETLEYECMFLRFIIDVETTSSYIESDEEWFNALIDRTVTRGYDNYLSMIYTNPYQLHDNFTPLKATRFDKGIEIAMKMRNDHQLSVAYHNRGIVYSRNGHINEAFKYYKKSQEIKERIGDSKRLAYIYNSLGYYYFITEHYDLSHSEYVRSFNASAESRDYDEVGMTLYNIGLNAFSYGRYTKACEYISMLLKLMKTCGLDTLRYHSKRNIYDIYVIALIKSGNENKGKDLYNKLKIWGIKSIEEKAEETFIDYMTDFYYYYHEESAEDYLNKAEVLVPMEETTLLHFRKFLMVEKALYYKLKGDMSYKQVIKNAKKEFSIEDSLETIQKLELINKSNDTSLQEKGLTELQDISRDFNQIIYTAKIDQNLLKLKNRLNEINFLNIVQNMLISEDNTEDLLLRFQQLIHGNTIVEKSFCRILKQGKYANVNLQDTKLVINEIYAERIYSYIGDKTKPHLTYSGNANLMVLKKVYGYSSIMYLPIYVDHHRKVEFVFMTQRNDSKLLQDDLGVMTLIGRQIGEAIERINKNKALKAMNHKLKILSDTDLLTGLNNRNALETYLQEEQLKINDGQISNIIILFVDLDNFKVYNDTYGHSIGDEILIQFGKILKEVTKRSDFVARFGGDEFVVLLKDKTEEEAHQIAHAIYNKIKEHNYFEGTISHLLESKIQIPKEKRLSCSIGMSILDELKEKDMDQLLKISDQALYKAKSLGKDQVQKSNVES